MKVSPSKINRFYQCPFSFKCHYLEKRRPIKTIESYLFGSMVHDIIPIYYDNLTSLSNIEESITTAFDEGADWRLKKRKTALRKVQANFKSFEKKRIKDKINLPSFTERKLTSELFPGIIIEGIIDAYWNEGFWVDWKTGKHEEMNDSRKIQGKIYELLLKSNDYPVKEGYFVNLYKGVTLKLPKVSEAWVETKIRGILEAKTYPKKKSLLCEGWCQYKLDCDLDSKSLWSHVI